MIVNDIQPFPKRCLLMPLAPVGARTDSTTRGVKVLCYWGQECGTKIVFDAHAVHFLKMETFFPLEGISSSPKCTYSHRQRSLEIIPFRVI